MPEEIEVDTDKLREQIDDEIEKKGGQFIRMIALTTALLAALAAIASLRAGATVNEALALKTEATQLQARASDQWAYYQAKGIKGAVASATVSMWHAAGKTPPTDVEALVDRYASEQKAIADSARSREAERDARTEEAERLMHQHHGYAYAVAFFQIAIALGAVAALTRSRPVYALSLLSGAGGLVFFVLRLVG
jgi:ABC-type Fe3+ transport system substrate-binding protein